jgi:hypothetical protein
MEGAAMAADAQIPAAVATYDASQYGLPTDAGYGQ